MNGDEENGKRPSESDEVLQTMNGDEENGKRPAESDEVLQTMNGDEENGKRPAESDEDKNKKLKTDKVNEWDLNPIGFLESVAAQFKDKKVNKPVYKEVPAEKMNLFVVECSFRDTTTTGTALIKKQAKREAALSMIQTLQVKEPSLLAKKKISSTSDQPKNYISLVQEYCQKHNMKVTYSEITKDGQFEISCNVKDYTKEGFGLSKKIAKHKAAEEMYNLLMLKDL